MVQVDLNVLVFGCKHYLFVCNNVTDSHKSEQHISVQCALREFYFSILRRAFIVHLVREHVIFLRRLNLKQFF